ncbi:hydantoinase/carbamoylase family amidase [Rhizobiaceae bacterium BDR2-2]|uniref:Hydantoinase/carbamoylase family amidase n=1 Tax=Ectorhizobium quercum TaxID=2965071 RepID=A0AAE3N303_9HYPH|nr:hydantoinase/carbamoylase family amidase [Ectorhizobium quercum]MCX8998370.1 hydantoinase/carbamoylase family amidase [Ectorhizobium quercum]
MTVEDTIGRIIEEVNRISLPGPGYTRPSYSPLETQAHAVVAREAERLGMTVSRDAASNLFARLPGRDRAAPPLHIGSHLDTVANGGAYDGQAGVAGAMALAAHFVESGETPPVDLVVTVTRAEESVWFPVSYIGSRAALGRLSAPELEARRSDTGETLAHHMRLEGGDPRAVLEGPGLPTASFIEIHIEQGPVLFDAGEPFALVSGVRGGLRYREARIEGTWAHSGGAPKASRADAVVAFADLVTALDRHWDAILADGGDLAVTFGRVDAASSEHAFAKVPGRLAFCIDIRSGEDGMLERMDAILQREIAGIEERRGVRFHMGPQSRSRPASLSAGLNRRIGEASAALDLKPRTMLSGGGHDAAAFAAAGFDSTMLFIRNWNGSHNPDEGMDEKDLALAVRALAAAFADRQADGGARLPRKAFPIEKA